MTARLDVRNEPRLPPDFPQLVRGLWRRRKLCQTDLSRLLGVSKLSILRWEHGRTRPSDHAWQRMLEMEALRDGAMRAEPEASILPQPLTRFVGREAELAELAKFLQHTRLVTLSGSGGCGKTRLAIELAWREQAGHADGATMVELGTLADPRLVPQMIATSLGLREAVGVPLAETLCEWPRPRHLLLLLDNCEHLIEPCAALAQRLLKACPLLTILATSREPLGIAGETVRRVAPLALASEGWTLERVWICVVGGGPATPPGAEITSRVKDGDFLQSGDSRNQ